MSLRIYVASLLVMLSVTGWANEMPPVPVEMVTPTIMPAKNAFSTTGVLESIASATMTPEVAGRISELNFDDGSEVQEGQVLFRIEDNLLKAELRKAKVQFDNSVLNFDRIQAIRATGSGSQSDLDAARTQLELDKANLDYLNARVEQLSIKAPFPGVVGLSKVEVGDYVVPGQALINLERMDRLKVDFKIPEVMLSKVNTGQSIDVMIDGTEGVFKGTVIAIDPRIDQTHAIHLRARMKNEAMTLRPGMFAKIKLIFSQEKHALWVPEYAVALDQDSAYVYVIEEDKAIKQPVTVGLRENAMVEIVEGLKREQNVANSGLNRLYDGAAVYPAQ